MLTLPGGWRPGQQIETSQAIDSQRRAFTPAVILFIAVPDTKDNGGVPTVFKERAIRH